MSAHRDGTKSVLQAGGLSLLFGMLLGDFVGGGAVVVAAKSVLQSSYSRQAEAAADAYGAELMNKAGGDARALGVILAKIGGATEPGMTILLDHPETTARESRPSTASPRRGRAGPFSTPPNGRRCRTDLREVTACGVPSFHEPMSQLARLVGAAVAVRARGGAAVDHHRAHRPAGDRAGAGHLRRRADLRRRWRSCSPSRAFVVIWRQGTRGLGRALVRPAARHRCCSPIRPISAIAAASCRRSTTSPPTPTNPPRFDVLARLRPRGSNDYPGAQTAALQRAAYPDIEPLRRGRRAASSPIEAALAVVTKRKWHDRRRARARAAAATASSRRWRAR